MYVCILLRTLKHVNTVLLREHIQMLLEIGYYIYQAFTTILIKLVLFPIFYKLSALLPYLYLKYKVNQCDTPTFIYPANSLTKNIFEYKKLKLTLAHDF